MRKPAKEGGTVGVGGGEIPHASFLVESRPAPDPNPSPRRRRTRPFPLSNCFPQDQREKESKFNLQSTTPGERGEEGAGSTFGIQTKTSFSRIPFIKRNGKKKKKREVL